MSTETQPDWNNIAEKFDLWLKERDPLGGIRNFEDVNNVMVKNGFTLTKDYQMPANNRILLFTKLSYIK